MATGYDFAVYDEAVYDDEGGPTPTFDHARLRLRITMRRPEITVTVHAVTAVSA